MDKCKPLLAGEAGARGVQPGGLQGNFDPALLHAETGGSEAGAYTRSLQSST